MLTAKSIEKIISEGDPGMTRDANGLYLKIGNGGSASWMFQNQLSGKRCQWVAANIPRLV